MSTGHTPDPAAIRARLSHPVIDSDGHWLEFGPAISEYLERVGGRGVLEAFTSRNGRILRDLALTLDERRDARRAQQTWWSFPTRNTLDRATAMLPRLLYERLDELGLDFCVLYPTAALAVPFIGNDELRRATCRAFNTFASEHFAPYADRMTPAAVVPMNTPAEAIEELEHVAKTLKLKVVVMASVIKRPIPAAARRSPELARYATWLDMFGLDSAYDYDPVWAKCVELGIAPTFHSSGRGYGMRVSVSNFTYNHIGHFAVSAEAVCKALFLGGVTRRFPELNFAFLEGGAGWGCQLFADLTEHWERRNKAGIAYNDPMKLDRALLKTLIDRYGYADITAEVARRDGWPNLEEDLLTGGDTVLDDFALCGIARKEDWVALFAKPFYFGCEADDRMNAVPFGRANPFGARINAMFSTDNGHFDVQDMRKPAAEAWELVEDGLLTEDDFRDFAFANAVRLWGTQNPRFFDGTAVAGAAAAVLAAAPARAAAE
jgi:predicted TIM-barrel fold metal-dependent hydrolase